MHVDYLSLVAEKEQPFCSALTAASKVDNGYYSLSHYLYELLLLYYQ